MSSNRIQMFDKFIDLANNTIKCDAECKKEKKVKELKKKYEDAINNYNSGKKIIAEAEKKYLTYAEGDIYYYNILKKRNRNKANKDFIEYNNEYNERINKLYELNDDIKTVDNTIDNLKKYYESLKNKYNNIIKKIDDLDGIVNTSNRKVYYENESITSIKIKKKIFTIIYYTILVFLTIYVLIIKQEYNNKNTILKLIIYLLFPLISLYIITKIVNIINYIINFLPNNFRIKQ